MRNMVLQSRWRGFSVILSLLVPIEYCMCTQKASESHRGGFCPPGPDPSAPFRADVHPGLPAAGGSPGTWRCWVGSWVRVNSIFYQHPSRSACSGLSGLALGIRGEVKECRVDPETSLTCIPRLGWLSPELGGDRCPRYQICRT